MHHLGLKFGLYVTPGISAQAVARDTPIKSTVYSARQIAIAASKANYNCGGMVGTDYAKPGVQAFVNSWAAAPAGQVRSQDRGCGASAWRRAVPDQASAIQDPAQLPAASSG